jgi:hypothetical protein
MSRLRLLALLLSVGALATVACGAPPDREIQQAQEAVEIARAEGAEQYAREEFDAARNALARAREAVELRDYRLALNHAIDSRDRAQIAAKQAAAAELAARLEADRALEKLSSAVVAAREALKTATAARAPAKLLAAARGTLDHADKRVQEARTAFERGDYGGAVKMSSETLASVEATLSNLKGVPGAPSARRP